ncbi:MAG: single-stranded DNA-binding protein [Bacteroidaceae bacterium]|nr:single-stranded DNA-binding protein [Bacteroidaceae bacterium]
MFKVEIIGNLGQDAKVVENAAGKFVSFSLAHSRKWLDAQRVEHQETEWFSCSLNGDGGGLLPYLKSGRQVFVRGDGKLRTWEDNNHNIHPACDVRVTEIQLCGKKDENGQH